MYTSGRHIEPTIVVQCKLQVYMSIREDYHTIAQAGSHLVELCQRELSSDLTAVQTHCLLQFVAIDLFHIIGPTQTCVVQLVGAAVWKPLFCFHFSPVVWLHVSCMRRERERKRDNVNDAVI